MTDLTTEAGVSELVKPILKKWARHVELTEEEAYVLLICFEDIEKPDPRPVPDTAAMRLARTAQSHPRSRDSLAFLALALKRVFHVDKDLRTLRSWCKRGLIPGARKTKNGGHWRVKWTDWNNWTPEEIAALRKRITEHSRKPKSLLRSRRWKNFEKKLRPVYAEYIPLLFELDAELRGATTEDLQKKRPPEPRDDSLRVLVAVFDGGNQDAMRYLKFRLEARRIFLAGKEPTFEALAQRVGISRRMMFYRYHQQAKNALNAADTPLTPDDRPAGISETLHEQVVSHFGDEAEKGTASHRRRIPRKHGSR